MHIDYLDHVALWVDDRDAIADFATSHLGMHEIERTDAFTIVGADARRGKLTLFAAEGPRERGLLGRIVLRVPDLEAAAGGLPDGLHTEREDGTVVFAAPCGLELGLVEADGVPYDLHHVELRVPHPARSTSELADLGFRQTGERLVVGESFLLLREGDPGSPERPLLNHLGLRVASADDHRREAEERNLEIEKVVDAENTIAVFVRGPDRLSLEYVEHKDSFSLV